MAVRVHLEELSLLNDYISLEEFLDICKQYHIEQEDKALLLSSYLHDIGAFLHFQDDPILENLFILDNQWVTDAVYKVLDDPKVKSRMADLTNLTLQ